MILKGQQTIRLVAAKSYRMVAQRFPRMVAQSGFRLVLRRLLKEDGFFLLTESGGQILLENQEG